MKFKVFIAIAAIAAIAFIGSADISAKKQKNSAADTDPEAYRLEQAMGTVLGTALNRTGFTLAEADNLIAQYVDSVRAEANKPLTPESQAAFLEQAASEPGAITMPSGLVFQVITEGEGAMPADNDSVRLLYTGSLSDGQVFDTTEEPVVFTIQNLVQGFTEGLKMMKPGGTYVITFPASLGYGESGIPGAIPGNAALKFRINLLETLPGSNE